jgi:hypothetical protein
MVPVPPHFLHLILHFVLPYVLSKDPARLLSHSTFMQANQLSFAAAAEIFSQAPVRSKQLSQKKAKTSKLPNQYFLFCQQRRTALQADHPAVSSREITRMLAEEWKNL